MPLKGRKKVVKAIDKLAMGKNDGLRKEIVIAFTEVILGTPVDTGRARANWFLSTKTPSSKRTNSTTPSSDYKKMPMVVLGKKTILTNNLPYIGTLEYGGFPEGTSEKTIGGFSRLAPKGWVRAALIRMQMRIKKI
ncbi:MAG: hypothetical protein GY820_38375 [Gammaproteobacteria bacterium]|nr:hypothetical protein [Gammaproteobacteria bacterium]